MPSSLFVQPTSSTISRIKAARAAPSSSGDNWDKSSAATRSYRVTPPPGKAQKSGNDGIWETL